MNIVTVKRPSWFFTKTLSMLTRDSHCLVLVKQPSLKENKTKKNSAHYHLTCFNVSSQMVKNTKVQTRNNHNVVANIINMEL